MVVVRVNGGRRNSEEWLRLFCSAGKVAQPTTSIGKMEYRANIASRPTDRNVPVVRSRPQCRVVKCVVSNRKIRRSSSFVIAIHPPFWRSTSGHRFHC